MVLLAAVIFGIYLCRRTSRPNNVTEPSPPLMNHTHLRSHSDVTAISNKMSMPNMSSPTCCMALSSSLMSPTTRTHASSTNRYFPFFSSGRSTISPPVSMPVDGDETAVEPFRLAPANSYNPKRKQENGAYPVRDQPTALPTVCMNVRFQVPTPTQRGRTRYNPPAYTWINNASPEAGGSGSPSSRHSPPTVGQVQAKRGSADSKHSFTSGGSAPRVAGGQRIRILDSAPRHTRISSLSITTLPYSP